MAQGSAGISGSIVLSGAGPFSNEPVSVITDPMQRARTLTCQHDDIKIVNNVKFNITVDRYSWYVNSTSEDRILTAAGRRMDLDGTTENQTGVYICKVTYSYAPQPSQPTVWERRDITFSRALFFVPRKIELFELLKPHFVGDSLRPALGEACSTSRLQIMAGDPLILNCTANSISPRKIAYQMWHIGYPGGHQASAFVIRMASVVDTGVWKCQAVNIWGSSMHCFNVTVFQSGLQCTTPPSPRKNSRIVFLNGTFPHGLARYECQPGYFLSGQSNITLTIATLYCHTDPKQWTGTLPTCSPVILIAAIPQSRHTRIPTTTNTRSPTSIVPATVIPPDAMSPESVFTFVLVAVGGLIAIGLITLIIILLHRRKKADSVSRSGGRRGGTGVVTETMGDTVGLEGERAQGTTVRTPQDHEDTIGDSTAASPASNSTLANSHVCDIMKPSSDDPLTVPHAYEDVLPMPSNQISETASGHLAIISGTGVSVKSSSKPYTSLTARPEQQPQYESLQNKLKTTVTDSMACKSYGTALLPRAASAYEPPRPSSELTTRRSLQHDLSTSAEPTSDYQALSHHQYRHSYEKPTQDESNKMAESQSDNKQSEGDPNYTFILTAYVANPDYEKPKENEMCRI